MRLAPDISSRRYVKKVCVVDYDEAFCQLHMFLHMLQFIIGEIDKSRYVSHFSTVPYIQTIWGVGYRFSKTVSDDL